MIARAAPAHPTSIWTGWKGRNPHRDQSDASLAAEIEKRFSELPAGVPGHVTRDEVARAQRIIDAQEARTKALGAALSLVAAAFLNNLDAANAGEAARREGLADETQARLDAVPPVDEVGLRWLVREIERSLDEGAFIPASALTD